MCANYNNIHFLKPYGDWIYEDGYLNKTFFYKNSPVEEGDKKLTLSVKKTI